jgi:aerobic-type carbon monoxide dehydrogenase small subunit (CoxS/CutS family)
MARRPHRQTANSCRSREAELSLQPVGLRVVSDLPRIGWPVASKRTLEWRGLVSYLRRNEAYLAEPERSVRMDTTIAFTVNGQSRTVTTDPQRPLLEVLREDLKLTGTKYGCGEGQCRACTVLLDGKSVASCITPVGDANQKEILTIEGLAQSGQLHPVQEAFLEEGASQCGYCTPGMIMGVVGLLRENPHPTEDDLKTRMQRHLCRCCNYPKLTKAIRRAVNLQPAK